jgi:hypothetical protein
MNKNLKNNNKNLSKNLTRKSHAGTNRKMSQREADTGTHEVSNESRREPIISLPEIMTNPVREIYHRYIASQSVSDLITIGDLLNQFLVATSATTGYSYAGMVRIKKVRVLSPLTTQGTSITITLKPEGSDTTLNNFNTVREQYLDTSTSIDVPAYLALTPSKDTPFGSWHKNVNVNTTGPLLLVNCPSGTTLDLLLEYIERSSSVVTPTYAKAITGANVGVIYATSICNGKFLPLGVNVI